MVIKDSIFPWLLFLIALVNLLRNLINYLIPDMASNEFRNMVVNLGAAIDQIPVTKAVVIRTTNTQPGTSPRLLPFVINNFSEIAFSNNHSIFLYILFTPLYLRRTDLNKLYYFLKLN